MELSHLVEHEYQQLEHQQYCNYCEVTKSFKSSRFDEVQSSSSQSSGLPSCTSAVSDPLSRFVISPREESLSLTNLFNPSLPSGEYSTYISEGSQNSEVQSSDEEEQFEEDYQPVKPKGSRNVLNYIDPQGWIKYASDPDPWNEKFYTQTADAQFKFRNGILTNEEISERTSNLAQLPDSKAFVFSRLHINKMDLENISVLLNYRHFLYIDMSWNLISDLNGLNLCHYLMYLNVSHNKISKVLDFKPPWFLTHVNLCCNEIKEIGTGNISAFWSLRYLDLSYNLIEKIEGLHDLRYLKYLNLSHNFVKQVENLQCTSLQELNLSFNKIVGCVVEDGCLHNLKQLTELNLAHNFLTTLQHFEDLTSLKKLDVSDNKITQFYEVYFIDGFKNLRDLKMTGNSICSSPGYREFLIFKLPSLNVIDALLVNHTERVAARMLWEPDIFTRQFHLRSKIDFWNQLAKQTIDAATVPCDEPPIPMLVLVGTFGSNKTEIAKRLELKFPDQVYRCKQVTTIPAPSNYSEDENLLPVTTDEFNNLIKAGKLLFYYTEIGCLFGVAVDQLSTCVIENKIGIIETTLEGALVLKTTGCRPYLVLCVYGDTNSYEEKLSTFFTESNLWNRFHQPSLRKMTTKSCQETDGSSREPSNVSGSYNISSYLAESDTTYSTLLSTSDLLTYESFPFSEKRDSDNQRSVTQKSQLSNRKPSAKTNKSSGITSELLTPIDEDDDFEWVWMYEDSVLCEVAPSESYQNMVRGSELFVRKTLDQQNMSLEMNQSHPSLFTTTVYSDDIDKAVKQVGKTCCEIYNSRGTPIGAETVLERPACRKFVEARVQSLMKDLVNVPTGV